jgi:chromosome segregation ATPase
MVTGDRTNQLVNKFVVSLTTGRILGYVTDINVEVEGAKFFFILKMKVVENLGKGQGVFTNETKIRIEPNDIVNVGPDVIVIGDGKIPPLREIENLAQLKNEYDEMLNQLREKDSLIKSLKEEVSALRRQLDEAQRELRRYEVMKEDFEHLKEQLVRQEGQLEMAKEYIRLLEGMRHDIDQMKELLEKLVSETLESTVRGIIDEELNARGLKKTGFL